MKSRPRNAENRIADELNKWFIKHGLSPVERIPVLGRAGPDVTYNELKLNLDAKSRKSIPASFKLKPPNILTFGSEYWGFPLCDLDYIVEPKGSRLSIINTSVVVERWIKHMGVNGGVILHWPNTPYKHAVLCLHVNTVVHIRRYINAIK